jgi:nucleoside-diphosphate-sugar epimerase
MDSRAAVLEEAEDKAMRVFVTGASGFIGSAVAQELTRAGHRVIGLARSESAEKALTSAGADVRRGDVTDLESLRRGAAEADAVIHLAFVHDASRYLETCEIDRRAIEALGSALVGSKRHFVACSGIDAATPGRPSTEADASAPSSIVPRAASSEALNAAAGLGVATSLVRLPPMVHDRDKHGLASQLIRKARETGISAYVGDGSNRWPAVHRLDAARLFALALERAAAGSRYHAVGEEGVALKDIATVIGKRLGVPAVSLSPEEAAKHFGWLTSFVGADRVVSAAQTREQLAWQPTHPGILPDLEQASL